MASSIVTNFMKQQGFPEEPPDACNMHFAGLYFQPRIVFSLLLLAITLGWLGLHLVACWIFLVLAAVAGWKVGPPRPNPLWVASNPSWPPPPGPPPLPPAPRPRRLAPGLSPPLLLA